MDENVAKGITIILFFVVTLLFGCIPYLLVRSKHSLLRDKVISYLNCFAGGVFLGATFLHLMVEGRHTLEEYWELADVKIEFPVYETIVACGFFIICLVEQLAYMVLEKEVAVHPSGGNVVQVVESPVAGIGDTDVDTTKPVDTDIDTTKPVSEQAGACGVFKVVQVKPIRAMLLLGAFSFHTVFDGLAVGLQHGTYDVWQMFGALMVHKALVALCLGLQLFVVFKENPVKPFLCILVFSIISPIGVGVGMAIIESNINEYAKHLVRGILEGISTGTFIYVAFFEILHQELSNKKGLLRLLLVIVGFAATAIPKIFHHEHHDNDNNNNNNNTLYI